MIKGKVLKGMLELSSLICILLLISIELKAAEAQKPKITQTEGTKLQDITIIKEPMRKVSPEGKPKAPHIKSVRADLTCRIHASYDPDRKKPVQGGVYYCSSWHLDSALIYFDFEVKNIGNAKAENFFTRIDFIIGGMQRFFEKASLEPGEAVVFPYYCGPIDTKKVKYVTVESLVDPGSKIEESNKDNNHCKLRVRFVPPQSPSKEMKPSPLGK
jgi:hypothetical protein